MGLFGTIKTFFALRKNLVKELEAIKERETRYPIMTTDELAALDDEELFEADNVRTENKVDSFEKFQADVYEFYNLGLGDPIQVSAAHGHGTGDLLDKVLEYLPEDAGTEDESETVKVAVIGKPNAGKSSLVNKIAGEERVIVSDIAGTTRDATDTYIDNKYGSFMFIDTAGLRRKSKVEDQIEKYSVIRARMAVERADVCVIMIDAAEGFTEQDSKVAGIAHELGKACIIAVNKWDLVEKDGTTMDKYRKKLMNDFSFMPYAPIIFISAKTGQRIDRLYELIKFVDTQNAMRIKTGQLNEILAAATLRVQPPTDKGKRLKIYYMTQASIKPPTFVVFVNDKELPKEIKGKLDVNKIDNYTLAYNEYLGRTTAKVDARTIVITSITVLCLIMLYFDKISHCNK